MNRATLIVAGVVLIILGSVLVILGRPRVEETNIHIDYRFGMYSFLILGKSYQGAGTETFLDFFDDTVTVVNVQPPSGSNGSLYNVYLYIWKETPPNRPASPDQMTALSECPFVYRSSLPSSEDVTFELVSDEPLQNLGYLKSWTLNFVLNHSVPTNLFLLVSGIATLVAGVVVLTWAVAKRQKPIPPPPPQKP
jgi:hypothetical protein